MISYNDQDKAWTQRLHKEIWTKHELKNFGAQINAGAMQNKYGLKAPENQEEMDLTTKQKFDLIK